MPSGPKAAFRPEQWAASPAELLTQLHQAAVELNSIRTLALLADILAKQGYCVRPAPDGSLALNAVAAKAPDLILLDVNMPGMDGYEVCRRLKTDERSSHVPIIFY